MSCHFPLNSSERTCPATARSTMARPTGSGQKARWRKRMHSELPCARGASDGRWGRHSGIAILQTLLHILIRGAPMPFLHIRVVVLILGEAMDFAPLFVIPLANALAGPDHFSVEKIDVLPFSVKKASGCVLPPSAPQQARGRKDDCDDTRTIANLFDDGVFYRCGFIYREDERIARKTEAIASTLRRELRDNEMMQRCGDHMKRCPSTTKHAPFASRGGLG